MTNDAKPAVGVGLIGGGFIGRCHAQAPGFSGWVTVEQERDPRDADAALRDARVNLDFLASIGLA